MAQYNHENSNMVNTQLNDFDQFITIPNKKLEADQYSVDDIDGVTEGLFGSGNVAFAILQSSQSNEAGASDGFVMPSTVSDVVDGYNAPNSNINYAPDDGSNTIAGNTNKSIGASDRPLDGGNSGEISNHTIAGNVGAVSVSTIAATTTAASSGKYSLTGGGGSSGNNQITNISNGGDEGDITTIINDITNLGDEIINNLINGDIIDIINTVNNEVNDLVEIINQTINNITENIFDIIDNTQITEVINNITNIVYDIKNIITDIVEALPIDLGLELDLDLDILDTVLADLNVLVEDSIIGDLTIDLADLPLESTLSDLTGLDFSILPNAGLGLDFNLLSGENVDDGNDVNIAGLNTPDIDLDLIEDIVGDINLNVALPVDVANLAGTVGDVQSLIASLQDLDLASPEEFIDALAEQSVEGLLELTVLDETLSEQFDISLEDAIGDIADLVGEVAGDLTGDLIGDPLGGLLGDGDGGGDSDLTLSTNLGDVDVNLDPVEDLVGDIDLNIGLDLFGNQSGEESDSDLLADIDIADQDILGAGNIIDADISDILPGDIDLGLGLGLDVLSDNADAVVNGEDGGSGEDTLLAQLGDALSDLAEGIMPDINDGVEIGSVQDLGADYDLLGANEFLNDSLNADIDSAISLLNPDSNAGNDGFLDEGVLAWTESALPDVDGIFGDLGGGEGNDVLPDPSGSVGEGLAFLNNHSDIDISGLGGVLG